MIDSSRLLASFQSFGLPNETALLRTGQILSATVLDLFGENEASISFGGKILHAKMEAPLVKGGHYLFEVVQPKGEELPILKVATSPEQKSMVQLLSEKWSLPERPYIQKALDYMIKENIPLSKETAKPYLALFKLVEGEQMEPSDVKNIAVRLIDLKLPPTAENVKSLVTWAKGGSLKNEMEALYHHLLPFADKNETVQKAIKLIQRIFIQGSVTNDINHIKNEGQDQNASNKILQKPQGAKLEAAAKEDILLEAKQSNELKPISHQSKLPAEKPSFLDIARNMTQQSDIQHTSKMPLESPVVNSKFMKIASEFMKQIGLLHESNITAGKWEETNESVKSLLLQVKDSTDLPGAVKQQLEQVIHRLTGQQLGNVFKENQVQQFLLQMPVPVGGLIKELTVKWEGKAKNGKQLDKEHCRILFWLELERLKEVGIDVQIQHKGVSFTVYNDTPKIEIAGRSLAVLLKIRLEALGYTLSSVLFKKNTDHNRAVRDHLHKSSPLSGLDVRI